ncbi:MAG: hypothetical protein EB100_09285, partial [Crocinitomicaceae bacterium]|nr:hypothetical protein [Crocinitomicaceae bacterium]
MKKISLRWIGFFVLLIHSFYVSSQGDNCYDATVISNPSNFCYTQNYSNATSTPMTTSSGNMQGASCWSTPSTNIYDVWFVFKAVGTSVKITVDATKATSSPLIYAPAIALLGGTCSGSSTSYTSSFSNLGCTQGGYSPAILTYNSLIVGQEYFIRISSTSSNKGNFGLCIVNSSPAPTGSSDCTGAINICDEKATQSAISITSKGTPPLDKETNLLSISGDPLGTKMTENQTIWYKFTCVKAGTLTFDIKPTALSNDLDFGIYESSNATACGTLKALRINTSSCVGDGTGTTGLNMSSTELSEDGGCDSGE